MFKIKHIKGSRWWHIICNGHTVHTEHTRARAKMWVEAHEKIYGHLVN